MSTPSSASETPPRAGGGGREPMVELRNVGLCYRRHRGLFARRAAELWAIKDLSLRLYPGETLGVLGRNGAGKSTLLRILAGIVRPDRGDYVNPGYRATLLSLQVGFVRHLSGRENVMLSGLLLGLEPEEIRRRMGDIVAFAELEEFIDEPIQTYSAGMRARLGFATALYVDPDILLIDEVFGVGDASFKEKSKEVMRERIRSDETVVLVSHSTDVIQELCDRAVWIERGETMAEGPAEEVQEQYLEWVQRRSRR